MSSQSSSVSSTSELTLFDIFVPTLIRRLLSRLETSSPPVSAPVTPLQSPSVPRSTSSRTSSLPDLPTHRPPFHQVVLEFSLPTAAQASITAFNGQIADGRTISVKFKAPSPSASPAPGPPTGPAASRAAPAARREPAAAPGNNLLTRLGLPSTVRAGGRAEPSRAAGGGQDLMTGLTGSR